MSKALKASHLKAQKLHKEKMGMYKNSLQSLEEKEDRIYDDHLKGVLDSDGYKRQFDRVRKERDHYTNLLAESDELISDKFYETADRLLELTKHSKSLWKVMNEEERSDLLKEVTSNRTLEGVSVGYTLRKPFETLRKIKNLGTIDEWCAREDLNLHVLSNTSPSSWPVYQFQHWRMHKIHDQN